MPCDSITLCQVHLGLANKDILEKTLVGLADDGKVARSANSFRFYRNGELYRINADGKLICREGLESTADEIKRAYSRQVVKTAASKFGWEMKAQGQQKLMLRRKF